MNVDVFKQLVQVARSTHFEIVLAFPGGGVDISSSFFCKGGQMPSRTFGIMETRYFGRVMKGAGDPTYEPWTVTVYNDYSYTIRSSIERWHEIINTTRSNVGATHFSQYQVDVDIFQLNEANERVKQYRMINAWPQSYDPQEVNWDNVDTPQEYTITFEYDYWTSDTTE